MNATTALPPLPQLGWQLTRYVSDIQTKLHWSIQLFLALIVLKLLQIWRGSNSQIPYVGSTWTRLSSLLATNSLKSILDEGYKKYPNQFFRTNIYPQGIVYIANGKQLTEEIRSGPDDVFDFNTFQIPAVQSDYTMGKFGRLETYHLPLIRSTLTRNLASLFSEIVDEMTIGFQERLDSKLIGNEWTKTPITMEVWMDIVSRASNRVVVGIPICRDKEYQRLAVDYTIAVMKSAFVINLFPAFLHPIVGRLASPLWSYGRQMEKIITPLIEERQKSLELYGTDWADKPNDYLMWLIESAPPGIEQTPLYLAIRVLHINFTAIHTSSLTFTHAILHLAAHPEVIKPLREEVEMIIKDEGWTKGSMQKMRKIDSFMRESSRLNALGLTSIGRYLLKPYTFSNGVTLPANTYVCASAYSAHIDDAYYPSANSFDAFRFSDIREDEKETTKHQMVATAADYLPFGYGKHACPGRFFAANELKAMLCYIVLNYDVKLEKDGERPPNEYLGSAVLPNRQAGVMIRRRV